MGIKALARRNSGCNNCNLLLINQETFEGAEISRNGYHIQDAGAFPSHDLARCSATNA